jgi:hypothetical protein
LDKEFTLAIYKDCTNFKLTCTHNISKMKKILNFQKCHLLSKCLETKHIERLGSLPQFRLDSNLDKVCSIVFYNPCTTILLTCTS